MERADRIRKTAIFNLQQVAFDNSIASAVLLVFKQTIPSRPTAGLNAKAILYHLALR
jgi:hypothetical protein